MSAAQAAIARDLRLFLAGDVMLARGLDQILPHPCAPEIFEDSLTDARDYVALAERANGRIPRAVDPTYPWGDSLRELAAVAPDLRLVNLETGITRGGSPEPKGINYRLSPENAVCLTAAGVDCCVLANNHLLDWGAEGLADTLESLDRLGIAHAGAGADGAAARAPAVVDLAGDARVLVFAFADRSSGVPTHWAASPGRPGVHLLADLSPATASALAVTMREARRPRDTVIASVHWGGNWGYAVPEEHRAFAHRLVDDGGADVVHGHSSHHAKALEVYKERLILYGCGDFLNDYEGIGGFGHYRGELSVMYLPRLDRATGRLLSLRLVVFLIRNFRLWRASAPDAAWLAERLNSYGGEFGCRLDPGEAGELTLVWS